MSEPIPLREADPDESVAAAPPTPAGLNKAGRNLWDSIVSVYELEPREVTVLELACRQRDDVARLERALKATGVMVEGSMGQQRLSQVVTELRGSRLALSKLLDALKLPEGDDEVARDGASRRGQHAAGVRWSRPRQESRRGAS